MMKKGIACIFGMAAFAAGVCAAGAADVSRPGLANPERGWRFEILVGLEPGE